MYNCTSYEYDMGEGLMRIKIGPEKTKNMVQNVEYQGNIV